MASGLFLCGALLFAMVAAENDAPKPAANDRVKKAIVIPPPGVAAAYGYNGNVYGYPYAGQQYYGTAASAGSVYPAGWWYYGSYYDAGKYHRHPARYDDGKYYAGKYDKAYNGYNNYGYPYATYYPSYYRNNKYYHNGYYYRPYAY